MLVAPVRRELRCEVEDGHAEDMIEIVNQIRSAIPAVTHVDYSARIQTVATEQKSDFWEVLQEFDRRTGVPVIVNTSFNVRGEPIVCSPQDAYRCFMRTEMDMLVLENNVLYKSEQPKFAEREDWRREYELD